MVAELKVLVKVDPDTIPEPVSALLCSTRASLSAAVGASSRPTEGSPINGVGVPSIGRAVSAAAGRFRGCSVPSLAPSTAAGAATGVTAGATEAATAGAIAGATAGATAGAISVGAAAGA
jgi:hypothetical protein